MAYVNVINPDGTVSSLEVEADSYGNIKPKGSYNTLEHTLKSGKGPKVRVSKSKKKNKATPPQSTANKNNLIESTQPYQATAPTQSKEKPVNNIPPKAKIITRQSIDAFFLKKISRHKIVTNEEVIRASFSMKDHLFEYFMQKYKQHDAYCKIMGWKPKTTSKKTHQSNSNQNEKRLTNKATVSSLKDSMANNDTIYKTSGNRHPKYGYARDFFGRVQERDSLNEERENEFKQSQKNQSKYDYSNYDSEDDHDSFYDSGSYE